MPRLTSAQVQAELTALIAKGDEGWQPDDRLPSYEELADEYKLSVPTIARMIKRMRDAGIIYGVPGRATYVKGRTTTDTDA